MADERNPGCPELIHEFYKEWEAAAVDTDSNPRFHALCMYMVGCLAEGGGVDLDIYPQDDEDVKMFREFIAQSQERRVYELFLRAKGHTAQDIALARLTKRLTAQPPQL